MPSDKVFTYTFYWIKITISVVKLCTKLARSLARHLLLDKSFVLPCLRYKFVQCIPHCVVCTGSMFAANHKCDQLQRYGSTGGWSVENGITAEWLLRICHLFVYSMSVYTILSQLSLFNGVFSVCGSSSIVCHRTCTLHPENCTFTCGFFPNMNKHLFAE